MIVAFPLTPALSLREREKPIPSQQIGCMSISALGGLCVSLSLRERAGVRGNAAVERRPISPLRSALLPS